MNDKKESIADALSKFNTELKRTVRVISGDNVFDGVVTEIHWDFDQWVFKVNNSWYCQSEINPTLL